MRKTELRKHVGSLIYKPGWKFTVVDNYGNTGAVSIQWTGNPDTNDPPDFKRLDNYSPSDTVTVNYIALSWEAIARQLIEAAIAVELNALVHEAREYFRERQLNDETGAVEYLAIFHPHHGSDPDSDKRGGLNWGATMEYGKDDHRSLPRYNEGAESF